MKHTFRMRDLWYAGDKNWTEDPNLIYWFYGKPPVYHDLATAKGVGMYSESSIITTELLLALGFVPGEYLESVLERIGKAETEGEIVDEESGIAWIFENIIAG